MLGRTGIITVLALAAAWPACVPAREVDPRDAVKAQERLDRELQRNADRVTDLNLRTAEERAKIAERAVRDPDQAARDLQKLEADTTREQAKIAEDRAKSEADFAKESEKQAERTAEDVSRQAAEAAEADDKSASRGDSREIRDLGMSEGAEHDEDGFPVRRSEVVAIDLSDATLATAQARGFRVIERQRLEGFGQEIIRLGAPTGETSRSARDLLHGIDPAAVVDLVHYYGLNLTAGSHGHRVAARPSRGRSGALTVGMIDTAVAPHAALAAARVVPWPAGNLPSAPVEHGTAVASLLAGEGSARILSANIFRGPADRPFTSADVIAEALEWMVANHVETVNMSLAGPRNAVLDRLIRVALGRGLQVVAAAGNGGPTAPPAYPAALPGVVAVTAVDRDLHIYRYANHGRYIAVAARGVEVVAARSAGGFARFNGTSFATPHVAGWIARCRAQGASAEGCRERLIAAARDLGPSGPDDTYGAGFID